LFAAAASSEGVDRFIENVGPALAKSLQQQRCLAAPTDQICAKKRRESVRQCPQPIAEKQIAILRRGLACLDESIAEAGIAAKLQCRRLRVEKAVGPDLDLKTLLAQRPRRAAGPIIALQH